MERYLLYKTYSLLSHLSKKSPPRFLKQKIGQKRITLESFLDFEDMIVSWIILQMFLKLKKNSNTTPHIG